MKPIALMRSRRGTRVLLALLALLASGSAITADRRHPLSVDDMMKVEGFGAATVDPTGRWLVFERLRPYEASDDYSFRTYAMAYSGQQLWRYDLATGRAPKLLPGVDPKPSSYLQGFSPSGRYLAVMQYRLGALSLGVYDMARQTLTRFKETPAFSRTGTYNPVWLSDHAMMFAALPAGDEPELTSVRAHTGHTLARAWEDAWHGQVVTASEVDSPTQDRSDQPEPGRLVRADARTGKTVTLAQGLYADLRVSPDRHYLAALSVSQPRPTDPSAPAEDDPRRYRLAVFDLTTGQKRELASGLEFFPYTLAWAPDGARLAAYGWPPGGSPRTGRFYVIDLASGRVRRYDHAGLDLVSERERGWLQRPERTVFLGDHLAVFARRIPKGEDSTPRFTYRDIRPTNLPTADWYAVSPDGTSTNLTQGLPGVSGVPIHAGNGHLTVVADDGVYRLYADGTRRRLTPLLPGRFRLLSPGTFATRSGVIRPDFTDEALVDVQGGGKATIVMVDLREGHEGADVIVDAPSADATPLAGSLAAGAVLFRAEDGPVSQLEVAQGHRPPRDIARINTHLADVDFGTWNVVSYPVKDPNGKLPPQTIESCVLLPPGYDPKSPPPLVVEVYPNVRAQCMDGGQTIPYAYPMSPYLWAGRGYAYACLTTPSALIHTDNGPIAGMPAVIDAGVTALVAHNYADPQRLLLYGSSQGGVSALYVAAFLHRFKAVIAVNSWADLFSDYFGTSGIYSYVYGTDFGDFTRYDAMAGSDFGIGRTPFQDPEVYYRNSPVFLAPKITMPVLLIHSDMDDFSMSQFDEMYGALLRAGKEARYVRYWGEGHIVSSPANIRDLWKRKTKFLIENGVASQNPPK